VVLVKGGVYNFTHCTFASFGNDYIQHKEPVLFMTNYLSQNNVVTNNNLTASFRNCIFWGDNSGLVENEVITDKKGTAGFSATFENVLWRVKTPPPNVTISNVINDQSPLFDSINTAKRFFSFRLLQGSPAINKGVSTTVMLDLDGAPRPVGMPDLGAYEKQ
ncbi:MAG TPA: choice-of-anchor Q domain-containing protein, partial [Chitinophagaceae bacterium]|nr:choice-of-anchor Q domain-containing protein [Chitinophagaceae bacterium]